MTTITRDALQFMALTFTIGLAAAQTKPSIPSWVRPGVEVVYSDFPGS